jgi:AcrR family transcriptional regulator
MAAQENKTDRRVQRTRRQLRDALMALILERGYNAVTIESITERADLGRTTFYLHYRDKEDLLVESLGEIAEELKAQVEEISEQQVTEGGLPVNPVAVAFHHVEANRDLYRIILQGEGSNQAASRIRDIIEGAAAEFFARHMSQYVSAPPALPRGLVAGYFAAALMGFVTLWLEKELPLDGDEAADLFMTLFFRGAAQVLNLTIEV